MKVKDSKRTVLHHFASVHALREFGEATPKIEANASTRNHCIRNGGGRVDWYGLDSLEAVETALRDGWQDGGEQIESLYDKFKAKLPRAIDIRRKRTRSEIGDSLDILAVYSGRFDKAWETTKRGLKHGTSLVRIVVDVGGHAGMKPEQLRNRGVAALALSRIITKAGYSCEIVAALGINEAGRGVKQICISATVKPRHANVDSRTLAATLALSGFFRTVGFRAIVMAADAQGKACESSLGYPLAVDSILDVEQGRVLQVITPALNTLEDAEQWIKDSLALFGAQTMSSEGGRA